MEARRKAIGAPTLQYLYPTNQGVSKSTAAQLVAAGVAPEVIAPDCHVGGGGGISCATGDFAANPGFHQSFIKCVRRAAAACGAPRAPRLTLGAGWLDPLPLPRPLPHPRSMETNDAISTMTRALHESADLQVWFNFGGQPGEEPGRLIGRTASFCAERSGHYDAFDQGISFFLPNMTWLQPPGYVHQMITATQQPNALPIAAGPYAASAQLSDDGKALTVQVVNDRPTPGSIVIALSGGFAPAGAVTIWTLNSTDVDGGNTPFEPTLISPAQTSAPAWPAAGLALTLPGNSFTIVTAAM
jgi:hypothetical protein